MSSRPIFPGLAIWGAIHAMVLFLHWLRENGRELAPIVVAWFNAAVAGLAWNRTIAAVTLTIWALSETWPRRDRLRLVAAPVGIGLSCGPPRSLFLRNR